jgi:hypothetical protein
MPVGFVRPRGWPMQHNCTGPATVGIAHVAVPQMLMYFLDLTEFFFWAAVLLLA